MQNHNVVKIEEAGKHGRSVKSVRRKLGMRQGKIYALKDKEDNDIRNFDNIVKAAEELYTDLNSTQSRRAAFIRSSDEQDTVAPSISSDKVRKALQDMTRGKATEEGGRTNNWFKDGRDIMLENLAVLHTRCLTREPEECHNYTNPSEGRH